MDPLRLDEPIYCRCTHHRAIHALNGCTACRCRQFELPTEDGGAGDDGMVALAAALLFVAAVVLLAFAVVTMTSVP